MATTYDSGDFPALFDAALERADVAGFKARAAVSHRAGKRRGSAFRASRNRRRPAWRRRRDQLSCGFFPVRAGCCWRSGAGSGQGHKTLYRRLAAERLGIAAGIIEVEARRQRLTAVPRRGRGCLALDDGRRAARWSRRSTRSSKRAGGRRHVLEAAEPIRLSGRRLQIVGTVPAYHAVRAGRPRPALGPLPGVNPRRPRYERTADVPPSFPQWRPCRRSRDRARHRAGEPCRLYRVRRLRPGAAAVCWSRARSRAGVAQGVGQALLESGIYDPASGQLLAGSFMDYAMPRADVCRHPSELRPVPCRTKRAWGQGRRQRPARPPPSPRSSARSPMRCRWAPRSTCRPLPNGCGGRCMDFGVRLRGLLLNVGFSSVASFETPLCGPSDEFPY